MRDIVQSVSSTQPEHPAVSTGLVAARLRRGVRLPSGRLTGESDRQVHLFPVPIGTAAPAQLTAVCGLVIEPGMADLVDAVIGLPCSTCLLLTATTTTPRG